MGSMFFAFGAILQVLLVLMLVNIQPFKSHVTHLFEVYIIFHVLLATWYVTFLGALEAELNRSKTLSIGLYTSMAVVTVVPLLYISAIVLYWLYSHRRFGLELVRRFHAWRHGYHPLE